MKQTKGRQARDGAAVRRVQVMLDDATIERAKALGDGNLSLGLRIAAREACMKTLDELMREYCADCFVLADAGNGVVWVDDAQVVELSVSKRYSATPGVMVEVRPA